MFTIPVVQLAVLIEIATLHYSPRANQCLGPLGGALGEADSDQQQ
jgi:hypothetical protein